MINKHRLRIEIAVIEHLLSNKTEQLAGCLTKQGPKSLILTTFLENEQLFQGTKIQVIFNFITEICCKYKEKKKKKAFTKC